MVAEVIHAVDESIATIARLAELGPAIEGQPEYFGNAIALLALIARESGHLEKLSSQLARAMLMPRVVEDMANPSTPEKRPKHPWRQLGDHWSRLTTEKRQILLVYAASLGTPPPPTEDLP
jgi:hypothetical protein